MYFLFLITNTLGKQFENADYITSAVDVACQPSIGGRLLGKFYLINETNKVEGDMGSCKTVLESNHDLQNDSLVLGDYKMCEMSDCGDLCDGCSIRFYHNSIGEDDFFAEQSDVCKASKTKKSI